MAPIVVIGYPQIEAQKTEKRESLLSKLGAYLKREVRDMVELNCMLFQVVVAACLGANILS